MPEMPRSSTNLVYLYYKLFFYSEVGPKAIFVHHYFCHLCKTLTGDQGHQGSFKLQGFFIDALVGVFDLEVVFQWVFYLL